MKLHQLSAEDALASLRSSADGLSQEEAARRFVEFGPNTITEVPQQPWLVRLLLEFTQFFSLVLWGAAILAFAMALVTPDQGMVRLGIAIVVVILLSGLFSFWQEYRAEHSLTALRQLLPHHVATLRAGKTVQLPIEALVPGDVVLLEAGSRIPADCRLLEAFGVSVNNATITGESIPLVRRATASATEALLQADNILLAGTDMVSGRARALVFATAEGTAFGAIAHLTQRTSDQVSPLRREVTRLSRTIVLLALAIGLLFFVVEHFAGAPGWQSLLFAIGIIVAMVPEGLLPTLTLALVLATQRMARRQVLIRHLPAVEALGATTVICTDKTGTLTQNRMEIKSLLLGVDEQLELAAWTAAQINKLLTYRPLLLVAGLCHDLVPSSQPGQPWQGDPMELALEALAHQVLGPLPLQPKLDELPFDAERMRLTTRHDGKDGPVLYSKGAPEVILPCCSHVLTTGGVAELTEMRLRTVLSTHEEMTQRGLRVLALAYRPMAIGEQRMTEEALVLAGLVGLEDPTASRGS